MKIKISKKEFNRIALEEIRKLENMELFHLNEGPIITKLPPIKVLDDLDAIALTKPQLAWQWLKNKLKVNSIAAKIGIKLSHNSDLARAIPSEVDADFAKNFNTYVTRIIEPYAKNILFQASPWKWANLPIPKSWRLKAGGGGDPGSVADSLDILKRALEDMQREVELAMDKLKAYAPGPGQRLRPSEIDYMKEQLLLTKSNIEQSMKYVGGNSADEIYDWAVGFVRKTEPNAIAKLAAVRDLDVARGRRLSDTSRKVGEKEAYKDELARDAAAKAKAAEDKAQIDAIKGRTAEGAQEMIDAMPEGKQKQKFLAASAAGSGMVEASVWWLRWGSLIGLPAAMWAESDTLKDIRAEMIRSGILGEAAVDVFWAIANVAPGTMFYNWAASGVKFAADAERGAGIRKGGKKAAAKVASAIKRMEGKNPLTDGLHSLYFQKYYGDAPKKDAEGKNIGQQLSEAGFFKLNYKMSLLKYKELLSNLYGTGGITKEEILKAIPAPGKASFQLKNAEEVLKKMFKAGQFEKLLLTLYLRNMESLPEYTPFKLKLFALKNSGKIQSLNTFKDFCKAFESARAQVPVVKAEALLGAGAKQTLDVCRFGGYTNDKGIKDLMDITAKQFGDELDEVVGRFNSAASQVNTELHEWANSELNPI